MKFKLVAILFASVMMVSCASQTATKPLEQATPQSSPVSTAIPSTTKTDKGNLKSAAFVKAEHTTTGTVKIVEEKGKKYLELDNAFKTESGPDLYLILYRKTASPTSGFKEKDYVSLSKLKKISGNQRYEIPATVKLEDFSGTAIWCRKFNATFGYAKFI
jgi:Electron transfer DM13